MNSVNECVKRNLTNHRNVEKWQKSGDELNAGWLSNDFDSSDETSADSIPEDYFCVKNYSKGIGNCDPRKAILNRAYNFIYDEDFSSETNSDNYSLENYCERNLAHGIEEDFLSPKKSSCKLRREYEISESEESKKLSRRNEQNDMNNPANLKSRSSAKILAEEITNFEDRESYYRNSFPFHQESRNTSRSEISANCAAQSISYSSDFLSETSNFEKSTFGDWKRKFSSKRKSKRNTDSETIAIRRSRNLSSTEFQDRFNHFRGNGTGIYETENPLTRISKSSKFRDRSEPILKTRKIYSGQIRIKKSLKENDKASSSEIESSSTDDDSFIIDSEKILQENSRYANNCVTAENILLENKNRGYSNLLSFHNPESKKNELSIENYSSDTHENEVKLLGDIKKRIDEDFECDLSRISKVDEIFREDRKQSLNIERKSAESGENLKIEPNEASMRNSDEDLKSVELDEVLDLKMGTSEIKDSMNASLKSSRQYFVDSIDSGVSTDFSRNESDISRYDHFLEIKNSISLDEKRCPIAVTSSDTSDSNDDECLEKEVDEAVEKLTEELIMCERRAVNRGLIDEIRKGSFTRKRKTSFRQIRCSNSRCSPKSGKTFSSPREFCKTSQSSSEEEYLENISPPSLCSISDSDVESLLDFYY